MNIELERPPDVEKTGPPPQFGIWQLLVVIACCALALAGWRTNLELLHPAGVIFFVLVIALMAAILLMLFRRWMKSWAEATVALLIATVLFAVSASEPMIYDGWGRRSQCGNNLRQIGVALHTYHDVYKSFPPAYVADDKGRPMHSWRVLLLPFLDQQPLYDQYRFDEPWDGPNNSRLHRQVMEVYRCPGSPKEPARRDDTQTSYLVVVGPHTAFPGTRAIRLDGIKDAHSTVIAVVEVKNSGIHWMEPRDLHVTQMATRINSPRGQGISSKHTHGAQVLFADGSVHYLDADNPPAVLRKGITIDDGAPSLDDWPKHAQ